MRSLGVLPIPSLEDIQEALARADKAIDAVDENDLSVQNVDVVEAVSRILSCAAGIIKYREEAKEIGSFDIANMDNLVDYAKAVLALHALVFPAEVLPGSEELIPALRAKLLMWAEPIAQTGIFSTEVVANIKEGSGNLDASHDVFALAMLYQAKWAEVKNICAVTEAEVEQARKLGFAVFSALSAKDNPSASPSMLRFRKAWTRLDRTYTQCRRAITYIRYVEQDYDEIAPSLRRNSGASDHAKATETTTQAAQQTQAAATTPAQPTASVVGGGTGPFLSRNS